MKRFLIVLLLLSSSLSAQHKFAWIGDIYIGRDSADVKLEEIVSQINALDSISFILVTGNITANAKNSELDKAKKILAELEKPLLIIPGSSDEKWSNSGGAKFTEIWDDDKFVYRKENTVYIGINNTIPLDGGGGHFRADDIIWLKEELNKIDSSKNIILASYYPLNSITDNWFKVTNLLRRKSLTTLLSTFRNKAKNKLPTVTVSKAIKKNFLVVENKKDKLIFYKVGKDTLLNFWKEIDAVQMPSIPQVDSLQLISKSARILFHKDIKTTLVAQPLFWKQKIYIADYSGLVSCYDIKGKLLWDYDTFGTITGSPSIVDNKFIVSTIQGELTILDPNTGDQLETIGFDEYLIAPPVIFNYKGKKKFLISKQTKSKAAVLISSASGNIYCYDLETLQEIWTNDESRAMIKTAPLVIGSQIIFGSLDKTLYSIDANNGTTIWKWRVRKSLESSPTTCKPVTDGRFLYFTTPDKMVYSIDLRLGTTKWKKGKYSACESIGISKNKKRLFIKSSKDKFHIISAKNGGLMKTVNPKFGSDTMPNTPIEWDKKIVFSAKNGYVYRIDKKLKYKKILFLGTSPLHSVQKIDKKRLMVSNLDGKVVIFNIDAD